MIGRQWRIARTSNGETPHAGPQGSADLFEVVAQEEPAGGADIWVVRQDGAIAGDVGLEPRIDSIEPVGDEGSQVGWVSVCVAEEQLLCWYRTGGVDDDLLASGVGGGEEGCDVREEGRLDLARVVAVLPEMALERLQVRGLDIFGDEVTDVSLQGRAVIAILFWEGIAILGEGGGVPLGVQDTRERVKSVGELRDKRISR